MTVMYAQIAELDLAKRGGGSLREGSLIGPRLPRWGQSARMWHALIIGLSVLGGTADGLAERSVGALSFAWSDRHDPSLAELTNRMDVGATRPRRLGFSLGGDAPSTDDSREVSRLPRSERHWHVEFGIRVGFPKLSSTEQQLDRRLDLPLLVDVLGMWSPPRTIIDRKSSLALTTLSLGLGRDETDWLTWNWYVVLGPGSDKEHQRVLIANLKTRFDYGTYLTGVRAEVYPWGRPTITPGASWSEGLLAGKPYVYGGVETGFIRGKGSGSFSIASMKLYADSVTVRDWIVGFPVGVGLRIPLAERWSFSISGDYIFQIVRPEEYNGWQFITSLRYSLIPR